MKTVNFADQVEAIPEEGIRNDAKQSTKRNSFGSGKDAVSPSKKSLQSNDSLDMTESYNFNSLDTEAELGSTISKEERVRIARERFEAERRRRLDQLKESQKQAEAFREQQLMFKKKKMEESRAKDMERRKSVEERRKKIDEMEQARRENLQRKLERIERFNESRRNNGPSNSRIFGFGSCTPREICTPIRRSTQNPPTLHGAKQRKDGTWMPSRTVISTADVHWLGRRRDSSEWGPSIRGLRGPSGLSSAHATLMTGSFTVAMQPPSTLGLKHRSDTKTIPEGKPMKRASSTTLLSKDAKRSNRIVPYPSEKDKLDRTASIPNIAGDDQKPRSRPRNGGAQSPTRAVEGRRPSSVTNRPIPERQLSDRPRSERPIAERPRPASAVGFQNSDSTPRRPSSAMGASSPSSGPSSAFFDRLSQPRRLRSSEDESTERRRDSGTPSAMSTSYTSVKPQPLPKAPPPKVPKPGGSNGGNFHVTFRMDAEEKQRSPAGPNQRPPPDQRPPPPPVQVNVEEVEADALKDGGEAGDVSEASSSQPNDTSAAVTPLPSDRSASPPNTLHLKPGASPTPPCTTPGGAASASPAKSEPARRPASASPGPKSVLLANKHPPTSALPPPSPPPQLSKGSAPSTPTGQRESPRAASTREVTEEEYRQRIAEQRRLARERMAAQEAEKARAREEERRRREADLQRLREEAERQQREEEEVRKKEEEKERQRQQVEEEERRRAAEQAEREEAERQRQQREEAERKKLELDEQRRKEEESRLERKKRLESIMSRVKKSTDLSGSRESLSSSQVDLTSNSGESVLDTTERAVSPAPQFKSALLQSMLSKGRLSTSIRAVSALRKSQTGSTSSLIADLQNLSRSSENLSSTSNSGPTEPTSSSGIMTTSQTEMQLSPPPVVNPSMWRSHPNGIPGLGGHERDEEVFGDEEVDCNPAVIVNR